MPSYSYVIPYFDDNSKTYVLVGQKQVIHYDAVLGFNFRKSGWKDIKRCISNKNCESIIKALRTHGGKNKVGKHFDGTLSPTPGKNCFFGGKAEYNESKKTTAIREFKEELNLMNLTIQENLLRPLALNINSNTTYFTLDLGKIFNNPQDLVKNTNTWIDEFDNKLNSGTEELSVENWQKKLEKIKNDGTQLPELRKIWAVCVEKAAESFNEDYNDWGYINEQSKFFAKYIVSKLDCNQDCTDMLISALGQYIKANEPIDWHEKAANTFFNQPKKERNSISSGNEQKKMTFNP